MNKQKEILYYNSLDVLDEMLEHSSKDYKEEVIDELISEYNYTGDRETFIKLHDEEIKETCIYLARMQLE